MESLNNRLAYTVKSYRKAKGISTHELAKILHISSGLLNNIENARTDIFKLDLLMSLANELKIPLNEILFSKFAFVNSQKSIINRGKIEITLSEGRISNNDYFINSIPIMLDSLIDLILRFENTELAAKGICNHIIDELNNLKTFALLK